MTRMVPEFPQEVAYGAVLPTGPSSSTQRCIDCLLGGVDAVLDRVYVVAGTVLCAGHAQTERMRVLQL